MADSFPEDKRPEQVRPPKPERECPDCLDGKHYRDPEFKEPYGYQYRTASIDCPRCKGVGWIV
jgi:hypothetical protein